MLRARRGSLRSSPLLCPEISKPRDFRVPRGVMLQCATKNATISPKVCGANQHSQHNLRRRKMSLANNLPMLSHPNTHKTHIHAYLDPPTQETKNKQNDINAPLLFVRRKLFRADRGKGCPTQLTPWHGQGPRLKAETAADGAELAHGHRQIGHVREQHAGEPHGLLNPLVLGASTPHQEVLRHHHHHYGRHHQIERLRRQQCQHACRWLGIDNSRGGGLRGREGSFPAQFPPRGQTYATLRGGYFYSSLKRDSRAPSPPLCSSQGTGTER